MLCLTVTLKFNFPSYLLCFTEFICCALGTPLSLFVFPRYHIHCSCLLDIMTPSLHPIPFIFLFFLFECFCCGCVLAVTCYVRESAIIITVFTAVSSYLVRLWCLFFWVQLLFHQRPDQECCLHRLLSLLPSYCVIIAYYYHY